MELDTIVCIESCLMTGEMGEDKEVNMFTRQELQDIKARAGEMAATKGLNPIWVRVYHALSDAADHLDAMIARCETTEDCDLNGKYNPLAES